MADFSKLENLKNECTLCTACELHKTRTNTVFGRGSYNASLLFIGEAPGEKEDLSGQAFVGASGKLLDKFLAEAGISDDSYFIANIIKCRPPKNRDPKKEEEDKCIAFLERQIELINPKVIVCLGRISAKRIIKKDFSITHEHGKWFEKDGRKITAVYHPAAILRDARKKDEEAQDFKKIAEMIKTLTN